ncbi:hypothetical protein [Emcibacter sp.]|uniref:hypothetical protein n=1 Tax=Emcibacter sp. TaxID=1979954 RepID=UPI002AA833B7|nr:hypothetical protein [Emcibacter sp.]
MQYAMHKAKVFSCTYILQKAYKALLTACIPFFPIVELQAIFRINIFRLDSDKIMLRLIISIFFILAVPCSVFAEEEHNQGELGEEVYLPVSPVIVTMFSQGRPAGVLTVSSQLKITDSGKRADAQKQMRRLVSAYTEETNRLVIKYFDINRPVNVALLGKVFQRATNRVLKHKEAQILIANVVVQKR